jgi:hypothetical protein
MIFSEKLFFRVKYSTNTTERMDELDIAGLFIYIITPIRQGSPYAQQHSVWH